MRSTDCITVPLAASEAPTAKAISARGKRRFHKMDGVTEGRPSGSAVPNMRFDSTASCTCGAMVVLPSATPAAIASSESSISSAMRIGFFMAYAAASTSV